VTGIDFRMATALGLRFAGRVIRQDADGVVFPAAPAGAASPPFQVVLGSAVTAQVSLSGPNFTRNPGEGTIAPDGSFQFTNLPPGSYQVVVSPALTITQRHTVTLGDRNLTDYQLVVPLMVSVPGTVTVEGGGPIPRVQLEFIEPTPRTPQPARVSAAPTFTTQLRAGDQRINVNGIPAGYVLKSMTSGGVDLTRNPLKVGPGVAPIQLVLAASSPAPWVRATGHVEGRGEWHLLVNFNINHPQVGSVLEPIFYLDGSFEFPATLPGEHQIRVGPIGTASVMSTMSVGPRGLDNGVIVVPSTAASTIGTQPDPARRAVRVAGRIVGRARASRGARVSLHSVSVGETFNAPIYMDGSFEFPRVPPGSYTAEIYPFPPGASPTAVTVGDADIKDLKIVVPDTNGLNGRLQMEGNALMPRTLEFKAAAGAPVSTGLRPDGSFQVELPVGQKIAIAAESIPRGHSLVSMTYGTVDLANNSLPSSAPVVDELLLKLRSTVPMGSVSGRVDGSAALPPGAVVWLVDSAGVYQTLETAIASDRTFSFPSVAPGGYTVRLSAPGVRITAAPVPVLVAGGDLTRIIIAP
jgi:hypothetical protein